MTASRGYVYVANGEGYIAEAIHSATSLRAAQPDAKICILTNERVNNDVFDIVQKPSKAIYLPIDKTCAHEAPFDEVIYLDTDTYIVSDISEIFEILERFDMAVLQALQRGWDYTLPGIPKVFSEYNTGVIAFRNNEKVKSFFHDWRECYEHLKNQRELTNTNNDQLSFRMTLFQSDIRYAPLPSEYHFRGHIPNFLMWDAKLIHCRGNQAKIAQSINSEMGLRVYIPGFGVYGGYRGKRSLLKQLFQFTFASLRYLISSPYDTNKQRPNQWHLQ